VVGAVVGLPTASVYECYADGVSERTWDERILDAIDSGVDETILVENLRRTPTERIERMLQMLSLAEQLRSASGHGHPRDR
jgi:hypothetical protein